MTPLKGPDMEKKNMDVMVCLLISFLKLLEEMYHMILAME